MTVIILWFRVSIYGYDAHTLAHMQNINIPGEEEKESETLKTQSRTNSVHFSILFEKNGTKSNIKRRRKLCERQLTVTMGHKILLSRKLPLRD